MDKTVVEHRVAVAADAALVAADAALVAAHAALVAAGGLKTEIHNVPEMDNVQYKDKDMCTPHTVASLLYNDLHDIITQYTSANGLVFRPKYR